MSTYQFSIYFASKNWYNKGKNSLGKVVVNQDINAFFIR